MYTEYFNKEEINTGKQIDNQEIKDITNELYPRADKLFYLSLLYRIWKESSLTLRKYRFKGIQDLWEATMHTFNYFNSFYVIKEYLESAYTDGKQKKDYKNTLYGHFNQKYLDTNSWIYFSSEYRNRLIHQTNIITDFAGINGSKEKELFICIEDFIKFQEKSGKDAAKRSLFISRLESFYDSSLIGDGKHFYRLLDAIVKTDSEMIEELKFIFNASFEQDMKPLLNALLEKTHKENGSYCYTYFKSENGELFDPCTQIENYLISSAINTGINSPLTTRIIEYLFQNSYLYLFTQKKSIANFIEQMTSLTEIY